MRNDLDDVLREVETHGMLELSFAVPFSFLIQFILHCHLTFHSGTGSCVMSPRPLFTLDIQASKIVGMVGCGSHNTFFRHAICLKR